MIFKKISLSMTSMTSTISKPKLRYLSDKIFACFPVLSVLSKYYQNMTVIYTEYSTNFVIIGLSLDVGCDKLDEDLPPKIFNQCTFF